MPERLLERALSEGARFHSVRREGAHGLLVECDAASAEILLNQCARFRLPARTLACRGKSALVAYARRRITLPVGILMCAALCWLFLGRIWLIDVAFSGETTALGDPAALRQAVAAEGIRAGMERGIDLNLLGQTLQAGSDAYSYVGAHLRGIRLLIEAVPETPSPPLYDISAPRDLVSDRDGIVLSAVARSGELCVQPGDAVRRGQLLIRGEELASADETHAIAALGEVLVRAWFVGEAKLPLYEVRTAYTGRSAAAGNLRAPWLSLPITEGERFADQLEETERLPIGGLFIPIEIERVTRREVSRSEVQRDPGRLRAQLAPLAFADAALHLATDGPEEFEVIQSWIDYQASGGSLCARAVYEISANAAVTRDALLKYHSN